MTEDISNYTFDFKDEVENLLKNPVPKLDKILFTEVHLSPADNDNNPRVEVLQKIGPQPVSDKQLGKVFNKHFDRSPSSAAVTLHKFLRDVGTAVIFNDDDRFSKLLGEENRQAMSLFALYHEAGHILVPGGGESSVPSFDSFPGSDAAALPYPLGEGAADAYAALRLLQRFGQEAAPLLSLVSWVRAYWDDATHLTTTVLDKIISDSATQDFSKLGAQETIDLAAAYAKALTPPPAMLAGYKKILADKKNLTKRDILNAALSSPEDNLSFYIAAKGVQPYLHHGGVTRGGELQQYTEEDIAKYTAAIAERAGRGWLGGIPVNGKQDPADRSTFTRTLPISLPAGQNKLILNWRKP